MSYSINRTFQLKLTTVTPVSIGDGGNLSPLTDYILDNGSLYVIDEKKFREAFGKNNIYLLEDFMQGVEQYVNKDKTEFLKNFIEKALGIPYKQIARSESGYQTYTLGNATAISTILKNGKQPFISGSTLKGAIKTALLYDWLLEGGKNELKNIIYQIDNFYTNNVYDINERDKLTQAKNEKNITSEQKYELRDIRIKLNQKASNLIKTIDKTIDDFLHKEYKDSPRDFHLFQVSDSELFDEKDLELHEIARFHLKKGEFDIPVFKETIAKNRVTKINLRISPGITHAQLNFLETASWEDIASKLNRFSLANVKQEIKLLNTKKEKLFRENQAATKGYEQFLTNNNTQNGLLEIIPSSLSKVAYIALGSGKSYFYNSLGLAIYEHNEIAFKRLVKILDLGKPNQEFFPITRALNLDYTPLGWVKLEPINP